MQTPSAPNAEEFAHLQSQISRSASWFYWIAGLSAINSLILVFEGNMSFVVGLGVTQIIDGIAWSLVQEGAAEAVVYVGLAISITVSAVFGLFGLAGSKRILSLYILGMVLYTLDGVIFLIFQDWFPFAFHLFALFGLSKAIGSIKLYKELQATPAAESTADLPTEG